MKTGLSPAGVLHLSCPGSSYAVGCLTGVVRHDIEQTRLQE